MPRLALLIRPPWILLPRLRATSSLAIGAVTAVAKKIFGASLLLTIAIVVVIASPWGKLSPLPVANGGFVGGEANGKGVVIGGTNRKGGNKNWLKAAYQWDRATLTWIRLGALAKPLAYGIGSKIGGVFVVIGGSTGQAPWSGVVRVNAGGRFIVIGGTVDATNVEKLVRGAVAFDPETRRKRTLPETAAGAPSLW
jgi:hypothetical protein